MKHLLNNLTEQEKNSIREQHTGGMKVSNNRFKALLENKLGNSKPLVEKFDDEDDYDFGFESPSCPSCKGNGCEECDGSGMKRNSVVNNDENEPYIDLTDDEDDDIHQIHRKMSSDDDEELYRGAPERLVKHMDSGKIAGTHKHGVGYTPNEFGKSLGHSSHPTSIPNYTKMEDLDSLGGMKALRMSNPNKGRRYRDLEEDTSWMDDLNEGDDYDYAPTLKEKIEKAIRNSVTNKDEIIDVLEAILREKKGHGHVTKEKVLKKFNK